MRLAATFAALIVASLQARPSFAWTLSEHTEIGDAALRLLEKAEGDEKKPAGAWKELVQLWQTVVAANHGPVKLCSNISEPSLVLVPTQTTCDNNFDVPPACVSLSDLPSLAADHSCSAHNLEDILLDRSTGEPKSKSWVTQALREGRCGNKIHTQAAKMESRHPRAAINLRDNQRDDINLQLSGQDPRYLSRAKTNISHFDTLRASPSQSLEEWLEAALTSDSLSIPMAFTWYHLQALDLASRAKSKQADPSYPGILRKVILLESFALHFVEDAFASGHLVTHSEDKGSRVGLHDHYCTYGIEAKLWKDRESTTTYLARGDAHMHAADKERAAEAVALALGQVLEVLHNPASMDPEVREHLRHIHVDDGLDTCQRAPAPTTKAELAGAWHLKPILEVLKLVPMPSVEGNKTLEPYRADYGFSTGVFMTSQQSVAFNQDAPRFSGTMTSFVGFSAENIISSYRQGDLFRLGFIAGAGAGVDRGTVLLGLHVFLPYVPVSVAALIGSLQDERWGYKLAAGLSRFLSWRVARDPFHLISISLGREANVIWSMPLDSSNTDPRARRVELQFPLFTYVTRTATETTTRHMWDIAYDLGGRVAWLNQTSIDQSGRDPRPEAIEVGMTFSASLRHRWFFAAPP